MLQGSSPAAVSSRFTTYYGSAGMDVTHDAAGDSVFLAR